MRLSVLFKSYDAAGFLWHGAGERRSMSRLTILTGEGGAQVFTPASMETSRVEGLGITACALGFRSPIIPLWHRSGWGAGGRLGRGSCPCCVRSSDTTMDGSCCQTQVGTLPSGSTFSNTPAEGRPVTTRRKHILFASPPLEGLGAWP